MRFCSWWRRKKDFVTKEVDSTTLNTVFFLNIKKVKALFWARPRHERPANDDAPTAHRRTICPPLFVDLGDDAGQAWAAVMSSCATSTSPAKQQNAGGRGKEEKGKEIEKVVPLALTTALLGSVEVVGAQGIADQRLELLGVNVGLLVDPKPEVEAPAGTPSSSLCVTRHTSVPHDKTLNE
jgi:hypothetical protein